MKMLVSDLLMWTSEHIPRVLINPFLNTISYSKPKEPNFNIRHRKLYTPIRSAIGTCILKYILFGKKTEKPLYENCV